MVSIISAVNYRKCRRFFGTPFIMAILKYWVLNIYWFKAFLATQDDSITDEEAASKYNEYKLEFRRQQLNEFFSNHKVIINPTETKERRTSSKFFFVICYHEPFKHIYNMLLRL